MLEIIVMAGLMVAVLALALCATEAVVSGLVTVLAYLFPSTFR